MLAGILKLLFSLLVDAVLDIDQVLLDPLDDLVLFGGRCK